MNFSERLKDLREEKEASVTELARHTGVAVSTFYHYLDGSHSPDLYKLANLANFFECSLDYLLGVSDNFDTVNTPCPPFGARLKTVMEIFGKTQSNLHNELHISRSVLFGWFTGRNVPEVASLIKLAEYFGCSIDFLVGREN